MFLVSLRLGAMVAGAGAVERAALDEYGARLGLVFQITDDLLDVRGDATAMGKRAGKDSQRGKLTFPGILGVEESVRRARLLVAEARAALNPLGPHAESLLALAHYVLERKH
jgi:geranylgeranyl diphosphate synthase type II